MGLLKNTGQINTGFDLIRRNKVIEGDENAWKPDAKESSLYNIFDGGHSNAKSRLFGELVFSGFQTNNNKSRIKWNTLQDDVKEEFLKYLHDLIKLDSTISVKSSRQDRLRDFWYQLENYISFQKKEDTSLKKVIDTSQDIISAKLKMDHVDFSFPDANVADDPSNEINYHNEEDDLKRFEFIVNESDERKWLIQVIPNEGKGDRNWFEYDSKKTPDFPKDIKIRWDVNHSYSKKVFKIGEDSSIYETLAPELFKLIAYLVIAEEKLSDLDRDDMRADIGRSYYRDFINKTLKLQ